MSSDFIDPRLESIRAVLWALSRLLNRNEQLSLAARYELWTLTQTGLQLTDEYLDSLQESCVGQCNRP